MTGILNSETGICGECVYHRRDSETGEFICTNPVSSKLGEETGFIDGCSEFEEL